MEKPTQLKFAILPRRLFYLLIGWMIFATGTANAQNQVSGRVTEQGNAEGIIGATVQVKGTSRGTITDLDGKYTIDVPGPEAVLVFSYIGYTAQEITVGNRSTIDIALESSAEELT